MSAVVNIAKLEGFSLVLFRHRIKERKAGNKELMLKAAEIINTRGLKGEMKLRVLTDEPQDRFAKGRIVWLDEKTPLHVVKYSESKGFGYLQAEEITTIEQAEKLKTHLLYVRQEDLPDPEEGEYYYHELMGCRVLTDDQEETGTVTDILETGANLVLRVTKDESSYLLPFVDAFVEDVDRDQKIIHIHDMEGLR